MNLFKVDIFSALSVYYFQPALSCKTIHENETRCWHTSFLFSYPSNSTSQDYIVFHFNISLSWTVSPLNNIPTEISIPISLATILQASYPHDFQPLIVREFPDNLWFTWQTKPIQGGLTNCYFCYPELANPAWSEHWIYFPFIQCLLKRWTISNINSLCSLIESWICP